MKLMFITDKPFGLIATPGTYLILEAYANYCHVKAFTTAEVSSNHSIVHNLPDFLDATTIALKNHTYRINKYIMLCIL